MPTTTDFEIFILRCVENGAILWVEGEENNKCETCEVNQQIPFSEYCQKCIDEWSDVEDSVEDSEEDSEEEVSKYLNLDKYICEDCNRDFTDEVDCPSCTESWDELNRLMCGDCFQIGNY